MSFSQITAVDLIVNQIVTIVTRYTPSSPAGIHALGDVAPAETIIRTSSNVGLNQINTTPIISNTVQVYNPLYSFGNQTFNDSNQPGITTPSPYSLTTPFTLGNRAFGFNMVGNATPVVDTGVSLGGKSFLVYNNLSTITSIDPAPELTNNNVGGQAVIAGAGLAGGSVLLNGTTQSLTANTAATWTYLHNGLQDYTIECWYYSRATTYQNLLGTSGVTTSIGFELSINNPTVGAVTVVYTRGVSANNTWTYANSAVATGGWYHVATTFASSTKRSNIYVNGNLAGTAANVSFAYSASAPTNTLGIGFTTATGQFNGQITNVRITKSIVYTANFTPTIPLTNISNTQLLLQFNSSGALLTDSSSNNNTITNVGVATYSTVVPPLTANVAAVTNYYNYSQLYFNGGLNIPYGDIASNVSGYSAQTYTAPGTYSWTAPAGVYSITMGAVGAGGGGVQKTGGGSGGSGGNVTYYNSYTVTPGTTYTIVVGAGGAPGGVFGITGGSTYMTRLGSNVAILAAGGGAGGNSLYWLTDEISVQSQDVTGIIARVSAVDPNSRTITYNISTGSLPTGAALNTGNGAITWTKQNLSSVTEYAPFTVSATVSGPSQTISKQYTIRIDTISYNITANISGSILYGSTITYVITTTGVADGTTLYWTNDGTTTVDEFSDSTNNGIVTIYGGGITLTRTLVSIQPVTGFTGSIIINLRTGSRSGTVVATGPTIVTVPQSFAITSNVASLTEGNTVQYTVTTGNVINGAVLYWTNAGTTSSADFSDSVNSGLVTINSNTATITRNVISDLLNEGTESILLQLRRGSTSGAFISNSSAVTVNESIWLTASVEYLIVAGGGGISLGASAVSDASGGGGGGGIVYGSTTVATLGTTMNITVGAEGSAASGSGAVGTNGGDSSINSVIAFGGGNGGRIPATPSAANGGSGGGGRASFGLATQISYPAYGGVGLGNDGAVTQGGGAGAPGSAGGGGYTSSISGTNTTYSIGGKYGSPVIPTGALANGSGYGHGGSTRPNLSPYYTSARPGIVIIRYPDTYPAATSSDATTITVSGGYRIYTWTGTGSGHSIIF